MKLYLAWSIIILVGGALLMGFISMLVFDLIATLFAMGVIGFIAALAWAIVTVNEIR